ncbi:MAG: c-type cytochrome [Burkholderiaceae bacterium]
MTLHKTLFTAALFAASQHVFAQSPAAPSGNAVQASEAASAQTADKAATVAAGKKIYTGNCARCHGINMVTTGGAFFDLRKFPLDQRERFNTSVTKGIRGMPAWGDTLKAEDLDALWAYVASAQK